MKRLLTLTALALVTASTAGCWRWFNRGSQCNPCGQSGYSAANAYPATNPCSDPYMGAPGVETTLPGPEMGTVQPVIQ